MTLYPLFEFWVSGFPRPKGSLNFSSDIGSTKVRAWEQVDPEGVWRAAVLRAARPAAISSGISLPVRTPVGMCALFLFQRPETSEFDVPATTKTGDLDKLVRNAFDAITPRKSPEKVRVVVDDSRFVNLIADADYVDTDEFEGAFIQVFPYRKASRAALNDYRRRMSAETGDGGLFG